MKKIEFIRFPNGRRNNLQKLNIPRQTPRFFNFVLKSNHFADCSWKGKGSGYLVVFVDLILSSELIWINIFCWLFMKGWRWISCSICKSNFKFKSDFKNIFCRLLMKGTKPMYCNVCLIHLWLILYFYAHFCGCS